MAKYTIAHTCGHQSEAQIVGPERDRASRRDWLAGRLCADCYRAAQRTAAQEQTATLPALVGSDKQIAWATTIRAKIVAEAQTQLTDKLAQIETLAAPEDKRTQARAAFEGAYARLTSETAAAWWIDRRQRAGEALLLELAAAQLGK